MKVTSIEELFGTLQQSIVAEWRKHLKTSKYSKHMALDEFYTEMPEKVDTLIEDYMGHTGEKVEDYKNVLDAEKLDALQYLKELHEVCTSGREFLDEVPELESDLDDILSLIDSTMYKVKELKENSIIDLKDFLNESLVKEGFGAECPAVRVWLKELKEYDDEMEASISAIPILKGNKINPMWLKKATARGWEYEDNNSQCLIWDSLLRDITPESLDDIIDWLSENWDNLDLADPDDTYSCILDIFPTFS